MTAFFRIGFIGYGHIAKVHIKHLSKFPQARIAAICSQTDKKQEISQEISQDISFYTNYEEMIKKESLDAAFITTPTYTHARIACFCAEQGIMHIFLEKPMARTLSECDIIIDAIKEHKVNLLVGHVLRFWPTYGSVRNYLLSCKSKIGDILAFSGKRLATFPWRKWFADQDKSGGVILDLSIHDIDYALWILGQAVSASCRATKINKYDMNLYGESSTVLTFENNKKAECEASWAKPSDFQFYSCAKVQGSKNFIEFDGTTIFNNDLFKIQNCFSSEDGYYNQLEHFFKVISNKNIKERFVLSPEEGKNAVKACLAALKSAENNGKEIFLEDLN